MSELNFIATLLIFVGSVATALQAYRLQAFNNDIERLEQSSLDASRALADHIRQVNRKALDGKRPSQLRWLWRWLVLMLLGTLLQTIVAYFQM